MKIAIVHLLSVMGFMAVSFTAQALSHFVINRDHFSSIDYFRPEPVFLLGLSAMVIQGLLISFALQAWRRGSVRVQDGLAVSLVFGVFLSAYISLVEPAKYMVPDIGAWMRVETMISAIQFLLFGVVLGFIHSKLAKAER